MAAEQQSDEALHYGLLGYDAVSLGSQTTNHQATFYCSDHLQNHMKLLHLPS